MWLLPIRDVSPTDSIGTYQVQKMAKKKKKVPLKGLESPLTIPPWTSMMTILFICLGHHGQMLPISG